MSCLPAVVGGRRGEAEFRVNRTARIAEPLRSRYLELRKLRVENGEHWTPALALELSTIGLAAEIGDPGAYARHVGAMVESASPLNQKVNAELGEDFCRYASSDEFLTGLRQVECPTLVLHGDLDPRPMWAAEQLVDCQMPTW